MTAALPPLWTLHPAPNSGETCSWCDLAGEWMIDHGPMPIAADYACANCAAVFLRSQAHALCPDASDSPMIARLMDQELETFLGDSDHE